MHNSRSPWEPPQFGQPEEPQTIEESWTISYSDGKFDQPILAVLKQTSSGIFIENLLIGQAAVDAHSLLIGEQFTG